MAIRRVRESDAEKIAEIYNEYVLRSTISFETERVTTEEMRRRIVETAQKYPYLVYEEEDEVKAYCYAHRWKEREAYRNTLETTVYVTDTWRGKGIGRRLMERLIDECRREGAHVLVACITGGNEASINLHERMGFEQVSHFRQVGRKFGRWLDVVDLQLIL